MNGAARMAALRAQNRVIRLEEKIRMATLFTPQELVELESLTMQQLIALRFASNPELLGLARRAVREKLEPKQIKEAIVSWRPDYDRV
jgi:cell division protein ZapA (FtsZ GTPase activity inhibitor)